MIQTVRRSWLIVPAHNAQAISEAADSRADVIVLDLQDTVHEHRKHEARANVRDTIDTMRDAGSEVFVRSDVELMYADFDASVWRGLSGVVLPGVTNSDQVRKADEILSKFEAVRGVVKPPPVGQVREADDPRGPEQALEIHLSLDTGPGNWHAEKLIRASDRVKSVSLGRADLVMDLREEPSGDLHLLPYLMQRLVVVANATGVEPVGAWWRATSRGLVASYDDTLEAATTGREVGFRGALCMTPHQVEALNWGFTPSASEIQSHSVSIQSDGPSTLAEISSGVLAWADACTARDQVGELVRGQSRALPE